MRFRGVLFDLDDTLTDRRACLERAAVLFAERFSGELAACEPRLIAQTMRETEGGGYRPRLEFFTDLLDRLRWKKVPDVRDLATFWETSFPDCSVAREGAKTLLANLQTRNVAVGIVTNGVTVFQQRKVDVLGIRSFLRCIIVSEAAGFKKPDGRIFASALDAMGVEPGACVFVGDHPVNDIVGSREAGLTAVWLTGMHIWPTPTPEPELQIARLAELESVLGM